MAKQVRDMTLQEFMSTAEPDEDYYERIPNIPLAELKKIIIKNVKHMSEVDQVIKHLIETDQLVVKKDGTLRQNDDTRIDDFIDNFLIPGLKEYNDKNPDPVITEGIRQAKENSPQ